MYSRYCLDYGDFESLVQLFTPDGVFVRNGQALNGHQAICEAYAQRPAATTVHFMATFNMLEFEQQLVGSSMCALVLHALGNLANLAAFSPMCATRTRFYR
jgi:hypothetical protein